MRIELDSVLLHAMARLITRTYSEELEAPAMEEAIRARNFYARPELVEHPERFYPSPPSEPPLHSFVASRLRGGEKRRVTGRSGFAPLDEEARTEWARDQVNAKMRAIWWRHHGPARPVVIAIHGWGCGRTAIDEQYLWAPNLYRAGLDVMLPVLPYHGPRSSLAVTAAPPFPSPRLGKTAEALAQSVWDIRRLIYRVRAEAPELPVAVMGWSLGGLVTSLLVAHEPTVTAAIAINPAVSIADLMWQHGEGRSQRQMVEAAGFTFEDLKATWAICDPRTYPPVLTPDRLLIVGGRNDGVCTPDQARELSVRWGNAPIEWHDGGHLLFPGWHKTGKMVVEFMREKMLGRDSRPSLSA